MKKIQSLLFAFIFCLIAQISVAQGFGARAGINISAVTNGNLGKIKTDTGYYLGVYKEISIVPKLFYVQPEVQFSKQGFNTSTSDFDMSYVHVPVLAKVYALKMFSFETGPQFGFKISDNLKDSDLNKFKDFDTAWAFGMSFNLPLGLSINGRYIGSFNEVIKSTNSKNKVIQLGASFTF